MCEESEGKIHSGCTAVTAFLRVEDADGKQSFISPPASPTVDSPVSGHSVDNSVDGAEIPALSTPLESSTESIGPKEDPESKPAKKVRKEKSLSTRRIRRA